MRIGLLGSHGTGKSTLVDAFLKKFPTYETPKEEHSRSVVKKGLGINFETSLESQVAFKDEFEIMINNPDTPKDFITPRTLIDLCAYNLYFFRRPEYRLNQTFVNKTLKLMLKNLKWWDLYLYVPIEFPIEHEDEFRIGQKKDSNYQIEIDTYINALLMNYGIPFFTLSGTIEERMDQLVEIEINYQIKIGEK